MALRKLLLILSLFFIADCYGQPMAKLLRKASACSYLLDQYSGAAAAYSLRKLRCAYSGSLIRVRRSSDNTEQDIGATANGDLDTAALKTFVGTGGTDDGFVVTWYDQSGNSRNTSESTAGNQPQIMDNGVVYRANSKPAVYFLNTSDNILALTGLSISVATTSTFAVFQPLNGDADERVFSYRVTTSSYDYQYYTPILKNGTTANAFGTYYSAGYVAGLTGLSSTALNLFNNIYDGSKVKNARNNGAFTEHTQTIASATLERISIGASSFGTGLKTDGNFKGYISEVIFYTSDKTSDRSNINTNINAYYSIY